MVVDRSPNSNEHSVTQFRMPYISVFNTGLLSIRSRKPWALALDGMAAQWDQFNQIYAFTASFLSALWDHDGS